MWHTQKVHHLRIAPIWLQVAYRVGGNTRDDTWAITAIDNNGNQVPLPEGYAHFKDKSYYTAKDAMETIDRVQDKLKRAKLEVAKA